MSFAKRVWRILVAIKDGLALLVLLLFFWLIYAVLTSSPNAGKVKEGALVLELDGVVVEQTIAPDPRKSLLDGGGVEGAQIPLHDVLRGLKLAATDAKVRALVLDMDSFGGGGQASLIQIGEAVAAVRKAGKPVLTYASSYNDADYLIAANASEIWLDTMGQAYFRGRGGSRPYFKGLADRFGVNVHVYKVGKFKSAVEPYIRSDQSPEAREANQALADSLWTTWQDEIKKARPKAQIAEVIANPLQPNTDMAQSAKARGLVDRLGSQFDFGKRVAELVGREDDARPDAFKGMPFDAFLAANPATNSSDKIGILTVAGEIVNGEAGSGIAGGDTISDLVLDALASKKLKALVVRVNSPGGSATASEQIRLAVMEAKAQKLPVVISMGDVAASGGYWVSMTGDKVFAEPSTVTGSIGVFTVFPTFEKTLGQYGVKGDGVGTTPLSGQPDILRGTNEMTDKMIQTGVEDIYRRFTTMVAAARKMDVKRVDEIGQGHVWVGGTARQLGLVDQFGSLDDAVAEAAKLAQLDPNSVERVYLEPKTGFLSSLLASLFGGAKDSNQTGDMVSKLVAHEKAIAATGLYEAARILHGPSVQARCIDCPIVAPHPGAAQALVQMKKDMSSWLN